MNQHVKPAALQVVPITGAEKDERRISAFMEFEEPTNDLTCLSAALLCLIITPDAGGMVQERESKMAMQWLANEIHIKSREARELFYSSMGESSEPA